MCKNWYKKKASIVFGLALLVGMCMILSLGCSTSDVEEDISSGSEDEHTMPKLSISTNDEENIVSEENNQHEINDDTLKNDTSEMQTFLIEDGTGHISSHTGYYNGEILYIDDYGTMRPVDEVYGWTYCVFDYNPETIKVEDRDGIHEITACYISDYESYYVYAGRDGSGWIQLFEQFPDGYKVIEGTYEDSWEPTVEMVLDPVGEWTCVGYFDAYGPYVAEVEDYYATIPEKYLTLVPEEMQLQIDADSLIQFYEGEEYMSMPWSIDSQTINVELPDESEYYGYYMVDENTIHEFYSDWAIYVYTRVQ